MNTNTELETRQTREVEGKIVMDVLSVAIQKLGAHNRVEAAHIAEQKGWL